MRLAATTMAGPMRHYFFEMGRGNTVAFFEVEGAETFAKPAGGPSDRAIQLDHISFDVPDEHALEMLRKRLLAAGSEVTTVVDHGFIRSVYFTDPNGIALEASWWVVDGTGRPTDYNDAALFGDPDPVPAVAELAAGGIEEVPAHAAHVIAGGDRLPVDPEHDLVRRSSSSRAPHRAVARGANAVPNTSDSADGGDPADREAPARPERSRSSSRSSGPPIGVLPSRVIV